MFDVLLQADLSANGMAAVGPLDACVFCVL
jgi:hypothetical protein